MTSLRSGSATDVGRRRQNNQDMILESETIFAVADGMGGHQGGEVASLAAIEALRAAFGRQPTKEGFEVAIREANSAVEREARGAAELRNMGTTLTAIAVVPEGDGDLLTVANIGDSRAYLLRDGELSQLTADHSVPQELFRQGQLTEAEAASDPRRNILTRVLGPSFGDGPDLQNIVPYTGDRLLLCSDGLYNEVEDDDIARILRKIADPEQAARQLVDLANSNGGGDNISVIVIDVVDDDNRSATASAALAGEPAPPRREPPPSGLMTAEQRNTELRRLSRSETAPQAAAAGSWDSGATLAQHEPPARRVTLRVVAFLVVLLLLLVGAAGAVAVYARGAYFVGFDSERVVIFKGRPGGLLWFQPTVEERTALPEDAVPPARVADLRSGHEVATLEEARRYVDNLKQGQQGPGTTTATTVPTGTPPSPTVP